MYDVINNLYHLIVLLQMETGNVPDQSNNISDSIGLQNVMACCGTDQKAIRYNGNIVKYKLQTTCFYLILSIFKKIKRCLELISLPNFLHNF